jgi:hypothetical protein
MMSVQDGPLDWRRLHQVLRHMGWAEMWAAGFGSQFSLHIDACEEFALAMCN